MQKFITRVELHGASPGDYELLHVEMASRHFARTVISNDGKSYTLPSGTYVSHGELSVEAVRNLAQQASAITGRDCWVMSAAYTEAAWRLHEAPK